MFKIRAFSGILEKQKETNRGDICLRAICQLHSDLEICEAELALEMLTGEECIQQAALVISTDICEARESLSKLRHSDKPDYSEVIEQYNS